MNCPIEHDLYKHLDQIDADNRAFEQAAELANDPAFIVRTVNKLGLYEVISGTGKTVDGLSARRQFELADIAHETILFYLARQASFSELVAALDAVKPAFDASIFLAAQDELDA
jgi:hypothetical protein